MSKEAEKPDFWQNKERAIGVSQELAQLKEEISGFDELEAELELVKEAGQEKDFSEFERAIASKEIEIFLSGKYDRGGAILTIQAGAGGQDSEDWATMLLRMYERYCQRKGFKEKIIHQSFGEPGGPEGRIGTKAATLEIKGKFAYGFLKKEAGVHRLVRISPFSSQALRHTSFALVEALPEIETAKQKEIQIKPDDLKIEFYKSSGPGGQYVNKRESAVRITHIPTGLVVSCQSERLQGSNKDQAMKMLYAKLGQLEEEKRIKELAKIKGKKVAVEFGSQIRNYVLHPYKLVKDLRTGVESKNPEAVLDGELEQFIEAEIKL